MQPLGDPHNFGQRVCRDGTQRICKPRTVFWEYLFLSRLSPLTSLLESEAKKRGFVYPGRSLPKLYVEMSSPGEKCFGRVEELLLKPLISKDLDLEVLEDIGRTIALITWFGIGDLHRANVLLGKTSAGSIIFSPIDIECIFEDHTLLSETALIPSPALTFEDSGLSHLLNNFRELDRSHSGVAAICFGFFDALNFLSSVTELTANLFASIDGFMQNPIRVIPRSTRDYHSFLTKKANNLNGNEFLPSELEQLERGDIPYYFRKCGDREIFYYAHPNVPKRIDSKLHPFQEMASSSRSGNKNPLQLGVTDLLKKSGPLQICRYFDGHYRYDYKAHHKGVEVTYTQKHILIKQNDIEIYCDRSTQ